jgi:YVTN family beta-propeller protein
MRSRALFTVCVAAGLAASGAARAKPLLLVSAEATGEVVIVDPVKPESVERVKVGPRPRGLKLSKDGKRLFVAVAGPARAAPRPGAAPAPAGDDAPGLAVIDVATRKVAKRIATPPAPFAVAISPDGRTAYVSNSETNQVFAIDVDRGSIKQKTGVGVEPQGIAVRQDGKVVFVATRGSDEISAIDTQKMTVLGRIDGGSRPQGVVFAPRAAIAVVTDEGLPNVTIVDAKQNTFKAQFAIPGLPKATPAATLQSAVFSPDGKVLYLTTGAGKSVLIVDPDKKTVVGTIDAVGAFPRGIAISKDGKKLYTANGPSNDVAIINVATKKVEARVAVPGAPWDIVVVP